MATIVTRAGKGSALTYTEMDNNFTNLNTDKPDVIGTPATNNLASFDSNDDIEDAGIAKSAVVTLTGTQALTNKTLTSPTITGATVTTVDINSGTIGGVTVDGNITANSVEITPTELGYIGTLTSNAQTQIDTKLASSSYTASDVLTKIKTVDGSGSGLDADQVKGKNIYFGHVAIDGTAVSLPSGWSSAKVGTGGYSITHTLNTTNIGIVSSAHSVFDILATPSPVSSSNIFYINTYHGTAVQDSAFSFMVFTF